MSPERCGPGPRSAIEFDVAVFDLERFGETGESVQGALAGVLQRFFSYETKRRRLEGRCWESTER